MASSSSSMRKKSKPKSHEPAPPSNAAAIAVFSTGVGCLGGFIVGLFSSASIQNSAVTTEIVFLYASVVAALIVAWFLTRSCPGV